jgi:hypothetical protein
MKTPQTSLTYQPKAWAIPPCDVVPASTPTKQKWLGLVITQFKLIITSPKAKTYNRYKTQ